jgi:hypothetical protein
MSGRRLRRRLQVGESPRESGDAVCAALGQTTVGDAVLDERRSLDANRSPPTELDGGHVGVRLPRQVVVADSLPQPCRQHAVGDGGAGVVGAARRPHLCPGHWRDRLRDVDAVADRPADAGLVAPQPIGRASTLRALAVAVATRAGVGGKDQLEAGRKPCGCVGPPDADLSALEWLPQRVVDARLELGSLVHEEDAEVREADRAGSDHLAASSDDGGDRVVVMRREERRTDDPRLVTRQHARDRMDLADLDRGPHRQIWQKSREPLGEHRLAGARRADE